KVNADKPADLPWRLVIDAMLFQAEAEIRWLDHCETSLVRFAPMTPAAAPTRPEAPTRPDAAPTKPEASRSRGKADTDSSPKEKVHR
ncbi:MAG TPA: hypothetical protein VGJ28_20990, partial [Micromonosporaceae bacterium]